MPKPFKCVATPTYTTTVLVPGPIGRMTTDDEWCHQTTGEFIVACCGVPLPAREPYCSSSRRFPRLGTCPSCARPRCPDCILAVKAP